MVAAAQQKMVNATPALHCPICDKSSWCRVETDASAHCKRNRGDAPHDPRFVFVGMRTEVTGEEYALWRIPTATGHHEPQYEMPGEGAQRADIEIRDKVYRCVLENSGNPAFEFRNGRNLPQDLINRNLYRRLGQSRWKAVKAAIAAGYEQYLPFVPGFYIKESDGRREWSIGGYGGTMIPVRDQQGRIQAIMIRADGKGKPLANGVATPKYTMLTSANKKRGGAKAGSHVHFPLFDGDKSIVRVTEGPLKADIATFKSSILTIGLPSVGLWSLAHNAVKSIGAATVLVAFDMDWKTNPTVAGHTISLIEALRADKNLTVIVETWGAA